MITWVSSNMQWLFARILHINQDKFVYAVLNIFQFGQFFNNEKLTLTFSSSKVSANFADTRSTKLQKRGWYLELHSSFWFHFLSY